MFEGFTLITIDTGEVAICVCHGGSGLPCQKLRSGFCAGCHVNGSRLIYLVGQVANTPDGTLAGVGDWRRQAEDFPAVAEIRSRLFPGELPASTLIVVNRLAQPELLSEVEGMAAIG